MTVLCGEAVDRDSDDKSIYATAAAFPRAELERAFAFVLGGGASGRVVVDVVELTSGEGRATLLLPFVGIARSVEEEVPAEVEAEEEEMDISSMLLSGSKSESRSIVCTFGGGLCTGFPFPFPALALVPGWLECGFDDVAVDLSGG